MKEWAEVADKISKDGPITKDNIDQLDFNLKKLSNIVEKVKNRLNILFKTAKEHGAYQTNDDLITSKLFDPYVFRDHRQYFPDLINDFILNTKTIIDEVKHIFIKLNASTKDKIENQLELAKLLQSPNHVFIFCGPKEAIEDLADDEELIRKELLFYSHITIPKECFLVPDDLLEPFKDLLTTIQKEKPQDEYKQPPAKPSAVNQTLFHHQQQAAPPALPDLSQTEPKNGY